jgi:hypothetical protein
MREDELRKRSTCGLCGKKIGEAGTPMFYTVKVERHIVDLQAVQRQTGLAMMLGGAAPLARVMGPDEEMTKSLPSFEFTVCGGCDTKSRSIAALEERFLHGNELDGEDEDEH